MNRSETAKVLGYLRFTYINSFAKYDEDEKEAMIGVWTKHFQNDDFNHVMKAVERLCLTSKWVPEVADIKAEMFKIADIKQTDVGDAWALVLRKCSCQPQIAIENYNELPANIQKTLGSPARLEEIGWMDPNAISFARKDFEKAYEIVLKRERDDLASGYLTYQQVENNNTLPAPKEPKVLTIASKL